MIPREINEPENEEVYEPCVEIQMHALTGNVVHHTIKIKGVVKKKSITTLIDSGSTYKFMKLKFPIK